MKGFKDVVILVLIAVVAGVALSSVNLATKDRIAEVKRQELLKALGKVMPFMKDTQKEVQFKEGDETFTLYEVEENGDFLGAALKMTTNEGFSGNITFLMGVDKNHEVTGLYILEHKETPGLGTKAESKDWWGQFLGKTLETFRFRVKKDGGDVDAITAATITSRAVTHAVGKGLNIFKQYENKRGQHE